MNTEDIQKVREWLGSGSINMFGLPFSGKDTQTRLLAEKLDAKVVAGGDILRSYPDQARIKELMSSGELFPTDFYLGIITPYLSRPELDGKPLVMSSVGRWHGEEAVIMEAAAKSNHPLRAVITLRMDETETWKRFEASSEQNDRGLRHDDAEHVLKVRLTEFQTKTLPVIEFYRNIGLLIEINGQQKPDEITKEILEKLVGFSHASTSP